MQRKRKYSLPQVSDLLKSSSFEPPLKRSKSRAMNKLGDQSHEAYLFARFSLSHPPSSTVPESLSQSYSVNPLCVRAASTSDGTALSLQVFWEGQPEQAEMEFSLTAHLLEGVEPHDLPEATFQAITKAICFSPPVVHVDVRQTTGGDFQFGVYLLDSAFFDPEGSCEAKIGRAHV